MARDRRLVLVTRGDDEFGTIYGCVLPRGKVRRLARWDDGLGRDHYSVAGTAGPWVLVANGYGDQYGGVSASLERFDVRSGRSLTLSSYGCNVNFDGPCATGTSFGDFALGPHRRGRDRAHRACGAHELAAGLQPRGPLHAPGRRPRGGAFGVLRGDPLDARGRRAQRTSATLTFLAQ